MAEKSIVRTEDAPAPFQGAPYSQAISAGGLVFVSGQLSLRPDHAEIVGDSIAEQTEQVFANLRAILEAAGSGSTGSSRRRSTSPIWATSAG